MFKALCRGVRRHVLLSLLGLPMMFCVPAGAIIGKLLKESLISQEYILIIAFGVAVFSIIASAYLHSFLVHCACAMEYKEQQPLVEAKEVWEETRHRT